MASTREQAEESYNRKLDRMGITVSTASTGAKARGHAYPQDDGTQGRAQGGRAAGYATEADNERTLEEKAPKRLRLDRPAYKNGGKVKGTTVNVIVAPQSAGSPPPVPPAGLPPAMAKPPGLPPGGPGGPEALPPPGGGGGMPGLGGPPPMMGRAHGGRVPKMEAGAGGGLGRLEKARKYGDRAKPGGKSGTF